MPRFYESARDAMEAPCEPKTPCRNFETRPCVKLNVNPAKHFRVDECLPHHCARYADHYEEGSIPHELAVGENGDVLIEFFGDYHDGPYCLRCKHYFCRGCHPKVWTEPCSEQNLTIF